MYPRTGVAAPTVHAGTIFHSILLWRHVCKMSNGNDDLLGDEECSVKNANAPHAARCITKRVYAASALRLVGHGGSLMRVRWELDGQQVVSAADDRTARVWRLPPGGLSNATCVDVTPVHDLWGHQARVWDIVSVNRCATHFCGKIDAAACMHAHI
jgi:WD40 repeat protein